MFSSLPCSSTGRQPCLRQFDTKRSWAQTTSSPSSTCRRPPTRPCSEYSSASVRASSGVSTPSVHPVSESFSEHRDEIQIVVMAELKPQPQPCLWKFIHISNKCCAMCWSRGPSSWPLEVLSSLADESWGSNLGCDLVVETESLAGRPRSQRRCPGDRVPEAGAPTRFPLRIGMWGQVPEKSLASSLVHCHTSFNAPV